MWWKRQKHIKNLIQLNNLKNEELAKKLGKSSSHISNLNKNIRS